MRGVSYSSIIPVTELREYPQPVKHIVVVVHWIVESGECPVHRHPLTMVRLVQTMHQQELSTSLNRSLHTSSPPLPGDLRVGPERLYRRHEGTVSHLHTLELRIITVPTTILKLRLRHPLDSPSDPRILGIP